MNQAPLFVFILILWIVAIIFLATQRSATRQMQVDRFLNRLAQETDRKLLRCHLEAFGFLKGDQLNLDGKFGHGVASTRAVARLMAHALIGKMFPIEELVRETVRHFTEKKRLFSGWAWRKIRINDFIGLIRAELADVDLVALHHDLAKLTEMELARVEKEAALAKAAAKLAKTEAAFQRDIQVARQVFLGEKKEIAPPANPAAANSSVFTP